MKNWILAGLIALLSLPGVAQESELKEIPGYVDFGALDSVYGEPRVRINIGGFLLKFMINATKDDPEAAALMKGLKGVRINVYNTSGEVEPAMEQVARVRSVLQAENWEPIVQVKEIGEEVQVFIKAGQTGETMEGLTVMAVNGEEAVFVNLMGTIDPAKLGQVMEQLDVDVDVDGQ
jgi:hypothetical protein